MSLGATSRSLRGISVAVALLTAGVTGCTAGGEGDGSQLSVFSLAAGDCYTPTGRTTESFDVEAVPCEEPHQGQVVSEFKIDDGDSFPGSDSIAVIADERCPVEAEKFAPDPWALPQGVDVSYYHPTKASWASGDRTVSCTYTNGSGKSSGSLRRDPLNADQLTYVKGSTAVYDALWTNQPEEEEVEDNLIGYRAQAKAVAAALETHVGALRDIGKPEVSALRTQLEKASGEWRKAASAGDADAFQVAYEAAFTDIDPNKSIAARKELGLATTIPADEAEGWVA
ncbi:septum formation family protein [Streptomyces sp. NPDC060030]|uniref:septum formation family protein n=1 Tax=Streptomyces sp. NPDC060030 TaxID=3347042 RepID=UPI0036B82801